MLRRSVLRLGALVLAVCSWFCGPVAAQAVTFTVNSLADEVGLNPGNHVCETAPGNGVCTLRRAIIEANHTPGGGATIMVPPGVYVLSIPKSSADDETNETEGDLDLLVSMNIVGAGAADTIIDGNGRVTLDRVFHVSSIGNPPWWTIVNISGLTIRNGAPRWGGGILNEGVLALTDVTVTGNTAIFHCGGIFSLDTLTLTNSVVIGNTADGDGGGICSSPSNLRPGVFTVVNSTVSGNTSSHGHGGGVSARGEVTFINSTVSGNKCNEDGGGISSSGFGVDRLTLIDSTVRNNKARFNGGGISNAGDVGTLTLTNSTVSGNDAGLTGGGMFNRAGTATTRVTVANSTIADNSAGDGGGIQNHYSFRGTLFLSNSTISGNATDYSGGGIANSSGTLSVVNSTVSGNITGGLGGGIFSGPMSFCPTCENTAALITELFNTTIVLNQADTGGGVFNEGGTVNFQNTILASNLEATLVAGLIDHISVAVGECAGPINSNGHNVMLQYWNHCTVSGDVTLADPLLGPLQSNGGATQTHALLSGGPAIDAGDPAGCRDNLGASLTSDQRGIARPQQERCDIGSFEFGAIVAAVELNQTSFRAEEEIVYQATTNPGATPTHADVYLGSLLPDRATFLSLVQSSPDVISMVVGPSPVPFLANVVVGPLTVEFAYAFSGGEPVGSYLAYAALAVAGSDPLVGENQLSLNVKPFEFKP